jgi:type VI secretion system protein ImpL
MHTARYGFWGYFLLIIGLAGICALLIFINQDVLVKKEYPSNRRGQYGGNICNPVIRDGVFTILVALETEKIHLQYRPEATTVQHKPELHNLLPISDPITHPLRLLLAL